MLFSKRIFFLLANIYVSSSRLSSTLLFLCAPSKDNFIFAMALVTIFEEAVYQSVALDVTQIFLGVTHVHLDVSEMLPTRRFQDRRMVYSSHPPHHPSSPNLIFLEVLYFRMWHQLSLQWHEPETKESFTSLAPSLSPNPTHHGFFHIRFKCIFIIPFHRHHFSLNFDHLLLNLLLSITDLVRL